MRCTFAVERPVLVRIKSTVRSPSIASQTARAERARMNGLQVEAAPALQDRRVDEPRWRELGPRAREGHGWGSCPPCSPRLSWFQPSSQTTSSRREDGLRAASVLRQLSREKTLWACPDPTDSEGAKPASVVEHLDELEDGDGADVDAVERAASRIEERAEAIGRDPSGRPDLRRWSGSDAVGLSEVAAPTIRRATACNRRARRRKRGRP